MKLGVLTRTSDLPGLQAEWNRLALLAPRDGAFRTYDWYWSWMQSVGANSTPRVITERNTDGDLIGVAPFYCGEYRDHGLGFKAIGFGGREVVSGDFLDLLASPESREEFIARVMHELVQSNWELGIFGELLEGGGTLAALRQWSRDHGYACRLQERRPCPYIDLPRTWEEYLMRLGPNFRSNLRKIARLQTHGVEVREWTGPADLQRELTVLIELHSARWDSKGEPGSLCRPPLQAFLRALCNCAPNSVLQPTIYTLRKGDTTLASLFTLRFGDARYFYQCGWDPASEFTKLRPMLVLLGHSIQRSIEEGLKCFEMLRGDHGYKLRFAPTVRNTVTVMVGRSRRARAYLAALQTKDVVKRIMKRPRLAPVMADAE